MLKWYKYLYLGETVRGKEKKVMRRLEKGKPVPGIWLVTLASNEKNNLDLLPADFLVQKALRNLCPMIVGIGFTRVEAMMILLRITAEVYEDTGKMNIRLWLTEKEQRGEKTEK